jgi:hypothetical protein
MAKSSSSKYVFILGEQFLKRNLYLGVASVLIVGGGILGLLYALILKDGAPVVADSMRTTADSTEQSIEVEPVVAVSEVVAHPTADDLPREASIKPLKASSLSELMDRHLKATGFGELDAFIVNGTASATSAALEVTLMARRPNLYKLKTESDRIDYMSQFGYDGQAGWFKQSHVDLQPEEVDFFMRVALFESSVAHLAWSYQSDEALESGLDTVLERLPSETWQGRPCAVVMSRSLLPFPMFHYIDLGTYEEVFRRTKISKGTEIVDVALKFASSDGTASPRIPMGYELYIDGALHDTVRYTKIRATRTILSSLFDAPTSATATKLAPRR